MQAPSSSSEQRVIELQLGATAGGVAHRAVGADLPLHSRHHLDLRHLHHGEGEAAEELRLVDGEPADEAPRPAVAEQHLIGGQEPLPAEQVDGVRAADGAGRPYVDGGGVGGVLGRAGEPEVGGEPRVHGGVHLREEAVVEGDAAGDAERVRAGERHEVGGVEADLGHGGEERRHVGARRRERGDDALPRRDRRAVAPAQGDPVLRPADQADGVARGEGEDVSAGDDGPAARVVEQGAELGDGHQRRRADGLVGWSVQLARLRRRARQQHRRVATLHAQRSTIISGGSRIITRHRCVFKYSIDRSVQSRIQNSEHV